MDRISLRLPFFSGFYNTIWDGTDVWYDELSNFKCVTGIDLDENDLTFDNDRYRDVIAKLFVLHFFDYAPSFITKIEFDEIVSPREYNFETDKIYAFVTFSDDWKEKVSAFINKNYKLVSDLIKRFHSSRSGFISFMSDDITEWPYYLFEKKDDRYLSSIIAFMMLIDEWNEVFSMDKLDKAIQWFKENLEDDMHFDDDYYLSDFFTLTESGINKCKEEELYEYNYLMNN